MKLEQEGLSYKDVYIIPQYSDISSRKEVDISTKINNITVPVPIITANMDTVVDARLAKSVYSAGGLAALHRFQTIASACEEFRTVQRSTSLPVFVSVGVGEEAIKRATELYHADARYFIIDIAHGHSLQMRNMIEELKSKFSDIYIMAGNVATYEGFYDLAHWGADAVKVGVGPGGVCLTKNVTGCTVPQFTAVLEASRARSDFTIGRYIPIVADGGCVEIGDVCKAIGAGADLVMTGKLFAGCLESPGKGVYRGSASAPVQAKYRVDKDYVPTPEGMVTNVPLTQESASAIVEHIAGGLRSSFSYTGVRNLEDFHRKVKFGVRKNIL